MQYRENLGNQSVDMAKVKCNICTWIVVGEIIQNQHLKTENSKSSNARNVMNYAWTHDIQCTKWQGMMNLLNLNAQNIFNDQN